MLAIALLAILGLYAGSLVIGLLIQRSILYPRWVANQDVPSGDEARGRIEGLETSWLELPEGERVEVWLVPGRGVAHDRPGPAVLFAHGNAERIDQQTGIIRGYVDRGISIMLCEYRGYGRSGGSPTQTGLVSDFTHCYDRLGARPEVDADRIVLHGRSLGTAVVSAVAARREAAAVILRSPFFSVRSMLHRYGLWGPFVLDPYDSGDALRSYGGPVLIMHGKRDEVIPFEHALRLHDAVEGSTLVAFEDAGHNDFPDDGLAHWAAIEEILTRTDVIR